MAVTANQMPTRMLHIIPTPSGNAKKNPNPNDNIEIANWNPVKIPIWAFFPND